MTSRAKVGASSRGSACAARVGGGARFTGAFVVWDPRTGQRISQPATGREEPVNGLALSADGELLAAGWCIGSVKRWAANRL